MSQYILYGYDYKTRELQGPRPAQLRPGGQPILTSGSATPTAPGLHKVGFAQVWRGVHDGADWPHAHLALELAAQGDDGADCPPTHVPLELAAEGDDGAWWYIADHRQDMDTEGRLIEGTGTPYWLPVPCEEADDWRSEPRYTKVLGPLPEGAVLIRPEKPAPTLEEARTAKLDEINAGYASVIAYIQAGYPPDEVLSWPVQAAQASELTVDGEAKALFVRSLAATKGLSVEEMRDRILVNAENWEPIAGMLTGQRQRMEEAALVAESVEAIAAIRVGYTA